MAGELSDGCVCVHDALLPDCLWLQIDDMDHFGPAWRSFPATDRYDPTRLWLSCVSIALREGGKVAHKADQKADFASELKQWAGSADLLDQLFPTPPRASMKVPRGMKRNSSSGCSLEAMGG